VYKKIDPVVNCKAISRDKVRVKYYVKKSKYLFALYSSIFEEDKEKNEGLDKFTEKNLLYPNSFYYFCARLKPPSSDLILPTSFFLFKK